MSQQRVVGKVLLNIEDSRSHSGTLHMVGLLWASGQPDTETYTSQNTTFTGDGLPCRRWDSNPQSQQACGRTPTP